MIVPSRRSLLAAAIKGVSAWLGIHISPLAAQSNYSTSGHTAVITLCSDLRCPRSIGEACRHALATSERHPSSLIRAILLDIESPERLTLSELAHALVERSRIDFGERKIVSVDGWILSVTETRLYALAGLLSGASVPTA